MRPGELFVTTAGQPMMQTLCVDSWATCPEVYRSFSKGTLLQTLPSGAVAYSNARFGPGTGPIYFNNLICNGVEGSIFECTSDGLGVTGSCTHADDAAVMCQESECLLSCTL